MTITVVNKFKEPNHIYCGRGSALGNPFLLTGLHTRDQVCDWYDEWFHAQLTREDNPEFHQQINNIMVQARDGDVNLGCFCAPKRCHCDTIKTYVEQKLGEQS